MAEIVRPLPKERISATKQDKDCSSPSFRPNSPELEEGRIHHDNTTSHDKQVLSDSEKTSIRDVNSESEIIYIDWEEGDPRNPANYSYLRKWLITLTASSITALSSSAASTYALGYASMTHDLNCTLFQATLGLSLYALGYGIIPLGTAALSEEFGRQPLYIVSTAIFLLMHLAVALAKNIQSVLIFRFIAGAAGSTGVTMVGGTVADIWHPSERGLPMAVFVMAGIGSIGLGPIGAGWIEMDPRLQWRWIQWIHLMLTGAVFLVFPLAMKETRSTVLLIRRAKNLRKSTGDHRFRARAEDERGSLRALIKVSCTRPLYLLFTEPVVISFSLWVGFAWGILFSLIESIGPAFTDLHHFNTGQVGTVYVTITIGCILGFLTNLYQERLYQSGFKKRGQEARLYAACVAGALFPVGMFVYAWTSFESVHWIGMAIGIILFVWALFIIYLTTFTYLADCYGTYASSAIAGQSLFRNLVATAFPLFTTQLYARLTFKWSSTLFACIAVLMVPIPLVLFRWGPQIRARSKVARHVPSFGS